MFNCDSLGLESSRLFVLCEQSVLNDRGIPRSTVRQRARSPAKEVLALEKDRECCFKMTGVINADWPIYEDSHDLQSFGSLKAWP